MAERVLIDGQPTEWLAVDDRGLAYGDGLFETLRVFAGRIPLWPFHHARLRASCVRLALPEPDPAVLAQEIDRVAGDTADVVIKLMLTRGAGARGYAPPNVPVARRILMRYPPPASGPSALAVTWCRTRLPRDPALGGMKHLNRLHQVLARREVEMLGADEGLCVDDEGGVVCATAANVFAQIDGQWCTPDPAIAGVSGACRGALLADRQFGPTVTVTTLDAAAFARASAVFLCNAVRGVMPVASLDGRTLAVGAEAPAVAALDRLGFRVRP